MQKQSLGKRIRAARNEMGLTQPELAQILGVTRATVSLWETDGVAPYLRNQHALADALGLSWHSLFGEQG